MTKTLIENKKIKIIKYKKKTLIENKKSKDIEV